MTPFLPSFSAVAVSAIFCVYQAYARHLFGQRQRLLRERVAYMLWEMARSIE